MSVLVINPGTTATIAMSSISGTVAPTTSGAAWEIYDRYTSAVVGTDITPNGWGVSISGSNVLVSEPASVSQGHDPDATGRYEWRLSATLAATLSAGS